MELTTELLSEEGLKLLRLGIDDLYAALGGQLLGRNLPGRAAGIVSYISALRSASEAKGFYGALPPVASAVEVGSGLSVIYEGLREDGMRYLSQVTEDLRKVLCNKDIFLVADTPGRSSMGVVITIVGAALRVPREFDPICATISAIIFKLGLRKFCGSERGDKG